MRTDWEQAPPERVLQAWRTVKACETAVAEADARVAELEACEGLADPAPEEGAKAPSRNGAHESPT